MIVAAKQYEFNKAIARNFDEAARLYARSLEFGNTYVFDEMSQLTAASILRLQAIFKQAGLYDGPVDGFGSRETRKAARAYYNAFN